MSGYMCISCTRKDVYEQWNAYNNLLILGQIPRLELVMQPYFTSVIKTSSTATYFFLHLSLPCAILTNGTQDAKQCPVVKKDTVCSSCFINISEN